MVAASDAGLSLVICELTPEVKEHYSFPWAVSPPETRVPQRTRNPPWCCRTAYQAGCRVVPAGRCSHHRPAACWQNIKYSINTQINASRRLCAIAQARQKPSLGHLKVEMFFHLQILFSQSFAMAWLRDTLPREGAAGDSGFRRTLLASRIGVSWGGRRSDLSKIWKLKKMVMCRGKWKRKRKEEG